MSVFADIFVIFRNKLYVWRALFSLQSFWAKSKLFSVVSAIPAVVALARRSGLCGEPFWRTAQIGWGKHRVFGASIRGLGLKSARGARGERSIK